MDDPDFISLPDAATRLSVTVRQCQRLARHLSDADRQIRERGATFVRWSAFEALATHRSRSPDMGRDGRGQNSVPDAQVATLVSQLEAAKAEIARLEADIVEFRSREARHLEVMLAQAQAMQRATERQRPLLLGQVTDQDATHSPSDPWYRRLWRRGRG